jgi:hypothetical protein
MRFRLAELENSLRQRWIQLGQVADRKTVANQAEHPIRFFQRESLTPPALMLQSARWNHRPA